MAANVLTNQTWELSTEYVPVPLQNKLISQCFLELLHLGPGANHAILRLVFKHPQVEASPRAPAGTLGLILNLEINGAIAAPSVPGEFVVRTLTAAGPHPKAVQSVELPVRGRKRVSNFLAVLKTAHLLPCTFNYIYPDAVGCRDFTAQYIYHLDRKNVLKLPADAATTVYSLFNSRYAANGTSIAHQAPRALFGNPDFARVVIAGLDLAP